MCAQLCVVADLKRITGDRMEEKSMYVGFFNT